MRQPFVNNKAAVAAKPISRKPSLQTEAGTYALILEAETAHAIETGKLGCLAVASGWYVYIGSAFGPGGARARCSHHLRTAQRPRWHIDYLRAAAAIREIWVTCDPHPREHQWANLMSAIKDAKMPLPGFGASDCKCYTHLFYSPLAPHWRDLGVAYRCNLQRNIR